MAQPQQEEWVAWASARRAQQRAQAQQQATALRTAAQTVYTAQLDRATAEVRRALQPLCAELAQQLLEVPRERALAQALAHAEAPQTVRQLAALGHAGVAQTRTSLFSLSAGGWARCSRRGWAMPVQEVYERQLTVFQQYRQTLEQDEATVIYSCAAWRPGSQCIRGYTTRDALHFAQLARRKCPRCRVHELVLRPRPPVQQAEEDALLARVRAANVRLAPLQDALARAQLALQQVRAHTPAAVLRRYKRTPDAPPRAPVAAAAVIAQLEAQLDAAFAAEEFE